MAKTTIGDTLRFGRGGNAEIAQLHGWSGVEDGFTWTLGLASGLLLGRPDTPHGFFIELTVDPYIGRPAPASQRMRLFIDKHKVADTVLVRGGTFAFHVHPRAYSRDLLECIIEHPDRARPEPESRDLALAFRRVRVLPLAEPLPTVGDHRSSMMLPAGDPIPAVEAMLGMTARDLVLSFETIAGNCEFGDVQRRCGSEPLNLLRFAGASVTASVTGLDTDFAGIGEDIAPHIVDNPSREWMMFDRRYGLNYHTLMSSNDVSEDEIIALEKRKVAFLRRKFFEDLQEGAKIFVCSDRFTVPAEEAMALFLALRRRSTAWLLWVQVAPDADRAGSVELILPGLMRGYIDRLARPDDGTDISVGGWLSVLANAWLLRTQFHQLPGRPQP